MTNILGSTCCLGRWNRRNLEWQYLAGQKCAKIWHSILQSIAIFLSVIFSSWHAHPHCAYAVCSTETPPRNNKQPPRNNSSHSEGSKK